MQTSVVASGVVLLVLCVLVIVDAHGQEVDFSATELEQIWAHGPWPQLQPPDPGNEFSGNPEAERIGAQLFHDKGLSGSGDLACSDCHQAQHGFSDGLALAQGREQHHRNTQGLLDVALQRWFGWDGGADSLWAASLRPMLSSVEMNNSEAGIAHHLKSLPSSLWNRLSPEYSSASLQALDEKAVAVIGAKLIAAYMRTLVSEPTAFDRFRQGLLEQDELAIEAYPAAAKRGLKLFLGSANCRVCHFGANFSNGEFHDTGRPFFTGVGQVDPGRYDGIKRLRADPYNLLGVHAHAPDAVAQRKTRSVKLNQTNWGQWRTPSLRNLTKTAPYMHDGSIPTLRGVVDAYVDIDPDRLHANGESILQPLHLTDAERVDLVVFLRSLSSP